MLRTIYKYLPPREDFFDNFLLRASNKDSLNDPFEMNPSINCLEDICLKEPYGIFRPCNSDDLNQFLESIPIEERWESIGHVFCRGLGIISLTETKDNLLMWSHYAQEHRGIVVEFDFHHPFFSESYRTLMSPNLGRASRVLYRKERLSKLNNDDFMEIFFHKSDEWDYEKEVRLLLPFEKSDETLVFKNGLDTVQHIAEYYNESLCKMMVKASSLSDYFDEPNFMFMFKVPKDAIKSVTFGLHVEDSFKDTIRQKIANDNDLNVKLYQASADFYDYRLKFNAIN
ncbi:DUF2971 domain-containing protein [Vibrio splendidus]